MGRQAPFADPGGHSPPGVRGDGASRSRANWNARQSSRFVNDGPAKQATLDFVHAATDPAEKTFVPVEARIATFDQDGTLWVEHPLYTQAMFALDRIRVMAPHHPEWQRVEPFKTVISRNPSA